MIEVDSEFDKEIKDEEGNIVDIIDMEETFMSNDTQVEHNDDYYKPEYYPKDIDVDFTEELLMETKNNLDDMRGQIIEKCTDILSKGYWTEENNQELNMLKEKYTAYYNLTKKLAENERQFSIKKQLEEIQANMVPATVEGILNILTEGGTKCWLYSDDDGNVLIDMQAIPQLTILLNELFLIAADDEGESSFHLTPKLIELISNTITLTAEHINLNGYISANGGNFSIDEQGNIEANDLNVNGILTCKDMNVTNIISPKAPEGIESNFSIYIQSGDIITSHLDTLPINLNGYTVNIYLGADTTENLELRRHYAGIINIFLCGHTIKGTIRSSYNNAMYCIYGGNTESDTMNIGSIMPNTGYKTGSYYYSTFFVNSPNVFMKNIKIFGGNTNTSHTVGIGCTRKSKVEIDNVTFVQCQHNARTYSMAELYCGTSYGKATGIGWYAGTGSLISFGANDQAGGSTATSTNNNGRILTEGTTFNGTTQTDSNTNTQDITTTRIVTYKPVSGGTYRYTLYTSWRKDNVVRQGKWGTTSGKCAGAWFYGSQFEEVIGKNIVKVEISVSRVEGTGNSASCSHSFQAHTHTTRPSEQPNFTSCNESISLGWGESGIITITDITILDGIKNGTFKGFGIKSSFDEAHYSALNNGTVKIYYTE